MADNRQTMASEEENRTKPRPSGAAGNPGTAGPGKSGVPSNSPAIAANRLNPSAPGETGTTPGSNAK